MSPRIGGLLGVVTGLSAVVLFGAAQANAAVTFTVTAGSAVPGTSVNFTGHTVGTNPQFKWTDATSGEYSTCVTSTVHGTTTVGSGLAGAGIGHINGAKTTWTECLGAPGSLVAFTGVGTWDLNATSFAAPITTGKISDINMTWNNGRACTFTLTGSVAANYNNSTNRLAIPGKTATLNTSNVSGCLGLIHNNDKMKIHAVYHLAANDVAFRPIQITSP